MLQKDIASYLNITTSAYGFYEQGKRKPDMETLKKLADFFNVSTDYLIGRTDNKKSFIDTRRNKQEHSTFKGVEARILERLIDEGVISEGDPITQEMIDKVLKYGIDATVEILKLKSKLGE